MMDLQDLIGLARHARACAVRAKLEEAYWLSLIDERHRAMADSGFPLQATMLGADCSAIVENAA